MADATEAKLIGEIYEASFLCGNWPMVLDRLTKSIGGTDAAMYVTDGYSVPQVITNPKMQDAAHAYLDQNWMPHNELVALAFNCLRHEFGLDTDLIALEDRARTKIYPGYFLPHDLAFGVGTIVTGPTDDLVVVSLHRGQALGPFDRSALEIANRLRPHIARAGFIASRLKLERLTAALAALEAVGLPAAALTQTGRLLLANAGFEAALPELAEDRKSRLRLTDARADAMLAAALAAGVSPPIGTPGCSLPMPAQSDRPPTVLHLVPVTGDTRDVFPGGSWILVAAPVVRVQPAPTALLEGLFDLTAGEARVARGLMTGYTVAGIASTHQVAQTTVRTQLQAIFAKTGTNRQSDLVALLSGVRTQP